jgi:hypothetical protein
MINLDKIGFMDMMNTVTTLYSKPKFDKDTLKVWYAKLERFDFHTVAKAFDAYVNQYSIMPTPADIIKICKQPPIEFTKLSAPKLSQIENKFHADKLLAEAQKRMPKDDEKKLKEMRAWAHRIMANPKKYPAISLQFAEQALRVK